MTSAKTLALSATLGAVSGMRTFLGMGLLAQGAARGFWSVRRSPLRFLAGNAGATTLGILAVSELVGDKMPAIPSRLSPGALIGRIAAGGICGALVSAASRKRSIEKDAALVGATAAIASAFAFYHLRNQAGKQLNIHDAAIGAAEDAIAAAAGVTAVSAL